MVDDAHWLDHASAHIPGFARPTASWPDRVAFVPPARTGVGDD
jgi:hypothetical protein